MVATLEPLVMQETQQEEKTQVQEGQEMFDLEKMDYMDYLGSSDPAREIQLLTKYGINGVPLFQYLKNTAEDVEEKANSPLIMLDRYSHYFLSANQRTTGIFNDDPKPFGVVIEASCAIFYIRSKEPIHNKNGMAWSQDVAHSMIICGVPTIPGRLIIRAGGSIQRNGETPSEIGDEHDYFVFVYFDTTNVLQ